MPGRQHPVEFGLKDLKNAWENVVPLDFEIESSETSSQFVQIVPGNDTVVLVLFEMRMGEFSGAMSLCIPYLLIKPILSKLSSQRWLAAPASARRRCTPPSSRSACAPRASPASPASARPP